MDAKEETAMNGSWRKGPGKELFEVLDQVSCSSALPGTSCGLPWTVAAEC